MRDGAVIFFVCVVLIGSVGWLYFRANGINPFAPATMTVQAKDEIPTKNKDQKVERPAHPVRKMPVAVKAKTEIAAVTPVVIPDIEIEPTSPRVVSPVSSERPQMPYPSIAQIKPGLEKARITQMYGDPSLKATTGSNGHTFDTFVYDRDRGDAVTIIRFEDGKVYSVRAIP
jgi:hypothetical protein